MRAILGSVLLAVSATAPAEAPAQFAGLYEINQMEMAGGLELRPDGRFRYALEYGSVSEQAEGKWTVEDGMVQLTTDPMPPKSECDRGFESACFDRTPLPADDGNLLLYRWDAKIVLKPLQPRPR